MCHWLCLLLGAAAFGATVDTAYYAPDRGTPYRWFEGAPGTQEYFTRDYRAAGYVCVYLRNDGAQALRATSFTLDGQSLAALREAQQVIWWRLLPNPLPPGMVGEFMLRLREPLTKPAEIAIGFGDGSGVSARVGPEPNPLRLATIGFTASRQEVFVVAESLDRQPREVVTVQLDGRDVTASCRLLAPRFVDDCSPLVLRPAAPLELGSFHTYTVVTRSGERAAACLKTLDGFVPLGSYGYGTYEEYARNGCNSYANFSKCSPRDLEAMARLDLRGVSMMGGGGIEPYEVAHPGLYAHYIHDEPDCADYGFDKLPHKLRIGQMAMEMERRVDQVRQIDPTRPSLLTIDMTYKPANYYVYAPIADITNPDCYPVTIGTDASQVREVVETCRIAAGPRPLTFTFSSTMEGPRDPAEFAKQRFPRANFPLEQRVMMAYAIGAGARGLFNYLHCTENSATRWSRGSTDWPELWNEIGLVYRELDQVAPLLSLAHPTRLATSPAPKLWLRTLLCGDRAAVIVWVNDNYQQKRLSVRHQPLQDVTISLPDLPWLAGWQAHRVGPSGFEPLTVNGRELRLPRAEVAGFILVTPDAELVKQLTERHTRRLEATGRRLLDEWRFRLAEQARRLEVNRLITGELAAYAVTGQGVGAYGMKLDGWWNPLDEPFYVLEFGANEATDQTVRGATFTATIPPERVGRPHLIYALVGTWGRPARLSVTGPDQQALVDQTVTPPFAGELLTVPFTPRAAGAHRVQLVQPGPGARGGRISHVIYVLPASEAFAPLPGAP